MEFQQGYFNYIIVENLFCFFDLIKIILCFNLLLKIIKQEFIAKILKTHNTAKYKKNTQLQANFSSALKYKKKYYRVVFLE